MTPRGRETVIRLGELLVKHNVITVTQLQQALKAQKIYGGRLGTNLVEMGFLTETDLTQFLAKQLNMPAAQPTDFEGVPQEILAMIPADFAKTHRVIPIAFEDNKLKVAFGDPLDLKAREETAFAVGHPIVPLVAPEILINYALEKLYGLRDERRKFQVEEEEEDESSIDEVIVRNQMSSLEESDEVSIRKELLKDVGEYTMEHLSHDLFEASSRDHVFKALFRYLEALFPQMAVFVQRQSEAWGWVQQGFNIDPLRFRQRIADLNDESVVCEVFRNRDLQLGAILTPMDRALVRKIGGNPEADYHLFPMLAVGRVVAVFLTTSGGSLNPQKLAKQVDNIQEVLTLGSIAFQMVRLRRKLLIKRK